MVMMMTEDFMWDYSGVVDILNIYQPGRMSRQSMEYGDVTIDVDDQREVIALEVMHASEHLGLTGEQLRTLRSAEIVVEEGAVSIRLRLPDGKAKTIKMAAFPRVVA